MSLQRSITNNIPLRSKARICVRAFLLSVSITLFSACTTSEVDKGELIASQGKHKLYELDFKEILAVKEIKEDDKERVKEVLNNWLKSKYLEDKARELFPDKLVEIDCKVEDFRYDQLRYAYQVHMMTERLDTAISDSEISSYYEEHKEDFILQDKAMRLRYVRMPNDLKDKFYKTRKLLRGKKKEQQEELISLAKHQAIDYSLDDQKWVYYEPFIGQVRVKVYNSKRFLRKNYLIEKKDSLSTHFIYILEGKAAGEPVPLELAKDKIRYILINQRKLNSLNEWEEELYKEAIKSGKMKGY